MYLSIFQEYLIAGDLRDLLTSAGLLGDESVDVVQGLTIALGLLAGGLAVGR